MTRTRLMAAAGAALTILTVVGVSILHLRRKDAVESEHAELTQQHAAALNALRHAEERTMAAQQETIALAAELNALANTKRPAATEPAPLRSKAVEVPSIAEQLQKNPAAQVSALAHERAHVLATYRAFFRQLGLSAEQIAKFQDNVLRKKERMMDLQAIMQQQGLTWQDSAVQKLRQDGEAEYTAAQRGLLDDDIQGKLADYERTSSLREMMIGWAGGAVVVAREPFTAKQAEHLVQIMANASANYRRGLAAMANDGPEYWSTVEAEAQKILSPAQFKYFTTTEPPLPAGARFQVQFYDQVHDALEKEAAAKKSPAAAKPSG